MLLSKFYSQTATEDRFTQSFSKDSVHDKLVEKNYKIVLKSELSTDLKNIDVPVELVEMSWGNQMVRPNTSYKLTRIAEFPYLLKADEKNWENIANNLTNWMSASLNDQIFLVSLNPNDFLVATTDQVTYDDILDVFRNWSFDNWLGVFDTTGSTLFYFDGEFATILVASRNLSIPNEFEELAGTLDNHFENNYAKEAKVRSGTGPDRAIEYFEKIAS